MPLGQNNAAPSEAVASVIRIAPFSLMSSTSVPAIVAPVSIIAVVPGYAFDAVSP